MSFLADDNAYLFVRGHNVFELILYIGKKFLCKDAGASFYNDILLDSFDVDGSYAELDAIKKYVINPVEAREASLDKKDTIKIEYSIPQSVKTLDGFLIGGRNIGAWATAFAYGTTYFSAVVFVGYAGQHGWNIGLGALWLGIGNTVIGCLLSWLLFANRTRKMTKKQIMLL